MCCRYGGRAPTTECPQALIVMSLQSIVGVVIQVTIVIFVVIQVTIVIFVVIHDNDTGNSNEHF